MIGWCRKTFKNKQNFKRATSFLVSTSFWESLPIADQQTFFFVFLHEPLMYFLTIFEYFSVTGRNKQYWTNSAIIQVMAWILAIWIPDWCVYNFGHDWKTVDDVFYYIYWHFEWRDIASVFTIHCKSCINLRIFEIKPYWIELTGNQSNWTVDTKFHFSIL